MDRPPLRLLAAVVVALLLASCTSGGTSASTRHSASASGSGSSPAKHSPLNASPHPAGVWWGIGGDHMLSVLPRLQQEVGRPFAIVRADTPWSGHIPGALVVQAATHGAIPYVSWDLGRRRGRQITFADVADGSQDALIRTQARSIRNSGVRMFFTFAQEPEVAQGRGGTARDSASGYVAAFERVHRIFRQLKATNVVWVATLGDRTYAGAHGGPRAWLPAPADYSYLGVDGDLVWPCEKGQGDESFEQLFSPAERSARRLGKPLFIGGVGVQEFTACRHRTGTPQGKADWITAAAATAKTWPDLKAITWTYGAGRTKRHVRLVWNEDSSPQALAAFRAAGLDPYFGRTGWS